MSHTEEYSLRVWYVCKPLSLEAELNPTIQSGPLYTCL